MDAGDAIGVVAQPKRTSMSSVAASSAVDDFEACIVRPMAAFAEALEAARAAMPELDDRFFAETRDGAQIDVLRARFAPPVWSVPVAKARGQSTEAALAKVDSLLAEAQAVLRRRRAGLHDSRARRLLIGGENQTLYPYGYLFQTNTLCFRQRERVQARALALGGGESVPACVDFDP